MPENNDGAKVCAEKHGDNCNDGSAGCINNEINNGDEGDAPTTLLPAPTTLLPAPTSLLVHLRSSFEVIDKVTMRDSRLSRPAMASTNPSSIISGHLYSTDDKLKRGRPLHCSRMLVKMLQLFACAGVPLGFSNSAWRHDSHSPHVLGTSDAGADNALLLLAVLPHTPPLLGTSDMAADTALHLPVVLPPTHPLIRICDIAAGAALHLPACCLLLLLFSEHPT
ncbi:unnamed protein product [Prunus armeniaca]